MQSITPTTLEHGKFHRESGFALSGLSQETNDSVEKTGQQSTDPGFDLVAIESEEQIAALAEDWRALLATSPSPEKLYQSPAFFRYLKETEEPGDAVALFAVTRRGDGKVAGLVPTRLRRHPVQFRAGKLGSASWNLTVVQLLGSGPMLADEPGLLAWTMREILARFPQASGLSMQALPQELSGNLRGLAGLSTCVLDGWRECHTIPLPASFDDYMQKFSSKKRYNLQRQVRLLAKEAGTLKLTRVDEPAAVPVLFDALGALMTEREFAQFPTRQRFERLAANGLLLSYVVTCGEEHVGAVVAMRSDDKWQVHNILGAKKYHHLSVGTSTLHLALEDVMNHFDFQEADFGYGTPNREFRSTHALRTRGHVLLYRTRGLAPVVLACHALYGRVYEAAATRIKQARRAFVQWRAQRRVA